MVEEIAPQGDEIVLPKTSSSPFNSTNLDYLLRNIGIEDVFVVGFLTDQCIDHVVKDGADRGYYMTCVHAACAAETEARHAAALLRRRAVVEIDADLCAHVRHYHEIAAGAERRIEDRPERILHQIGMGPADALLLAGGQLACRKPLAAHMPCDIAGPDKDQLLTQHGGQNTGTPR